YEWLQRSRVTHVHVTPQLCKVVCAGKRESAPLSDLACVFSGGDALRRALAHELRAVAPGAKLVNFYGATETPQAMGFHVFGAHDVKDAIPIGRGIADVQLLVLDERAALAGIGILGQIAIRTRFLSSGYLDDAESNAKKFVATPGARDPEDRCYLSGDYGYFAHDGEVIVTGRLDDQVKVRGYRVELAEIVRQLERQAEVQSAVVLPERAPSGENRLIAYLVGKSAVDRASEGAAGERVKAALCATLPAYMVPSAYVWLARFPLLPNGKLDRGRLPAPQSAPAEGDVAPGNELERALVEQWQALLGVAAIGVGRSFIELGGDSLSFIQASSKLEALLGWLPERWEQRSIRDL